MTRRIYFFIEDKNSSFVIKKQKFQANQTQFPKIIKNEPQEPIEK